MCMLKSGIILKDKVFVPDYDHHTKMLEELGIEDTEQNAKTLFVRAELIPNDDVFTDIETWNFVVEQDILPDWFVRDYDVERMIKAVKEWGKNHIFINQNDIDISDASCFYLKNCDDVMACGSSNVTAYGSSSVTSCGSSSVTAYGSSSVRAFDNSSVTAYGSSSVTAFDNSSVRAYNSSSVTSCGSSSVTAYGNSSVRAYNSSSVTSCDSSNVTACGSSSVIIPHFSKCPAKNITLHNFATLKDIPNKTIYQAGDYKLVNYEYEKAE